jgi:hypothetical protein
LYSVFAAQSVGLLLLILLILTSIQYSSEVLSGDLKELYNITKKLSGKGFNRKKPVRRKRGEIIPTQEEQLKRWKEHFSELLNMVVHMKNQHGR